MASRVAPLLEELRASYVAKGCAVDSYLRPGLTREAVLERTRRLPFELPDELVELYCWRDGQTEEGELAADSFVFRDNDFISLERALSGYDEIQSAYGPFVSDEYTPLGFELEHAFPFATFMGSWHALVCGPHTLESSDPYPVVNVFQGIELFFHSLESMLETCIAWASHPSWEPATSLAEDVEIGIWQQHNPGIFPWHG